MQEYHIHYQRFGEKCFQLIRDYHFLSAIKTGHPFTMNFVRYDGDGQFCIREGFCWDGPSGWAIPDKTTLRASLEHDCKYRAMREGLIDADKFREIADNELEETMEEDGCSEFRSEYFYIAVHDFGKKNSIGGNPLLEAP
jgi:hypothetical protein